jgi:hypothetical protein
MKLEDRSFIKYVAVGVCGPSSVSRVEVEAEDGWDILKSLPHRHVLDVEKTSRTGSRVLVSTDGVREVVDSIMQQSGVLGVATRAPSLED